MLALKYLLIVAGVVLFGSSGTLVAYDIYLSEQLRRLLGRSKATKKRGEVATTVQRPLRPIRWKLAQHLAVLAIVPVLLSLTIVAAPAGFAGARVSQSWRMRPGMLYPGVRLVTPLAKGKLFEIKKFVQSRQLSAPPSSASQSPCGWLATRTGKEERS